MCSLVVYQEIVLMLLIHKKYTITIESLKDIDNQTKI